MKMDFKALLILPCLAIALPAVADVKETIPGRSSFSKIRSSKEQKRFPSENCEVIAEAEIEVVWKIYRNGEEKECRARGVAPISEGRDKECLIDFDQQMRTPCPVDVDGQDRTVAVGGHFNRDPITNQDRLMFFYFTVDSMSASVISSTSSYVTAPSIDLAAVKDVTGEAMSTTFEEAKSATDVLSIHVLKAWKLK